jgi:hypothetical protein
LFEPLINQHFLVLELHAGTSEAVVVAIVVSAVGLEAQPAELVLALFAVYVIAALVFFDGGLAIGALSSYLLFYLILKILKVFYRAFLRTMSQLLPSW